MTAANTRTSVDEVEIAKFTAMAEEWWDPKGKFAPLHAFNPVRLEFIRDVLIRHFDRDPRALRPFEGLTLLDIGCGGGLISEPMSRMGFRVIGADASATNIRIARSHADETGVAVEYRAGTAEELLAEGRTFDVVLNLEVVEHVADIESYMSAAAGLIAPGGMTIVSTINKTLKALMLAKFAAEYVLGWLPPGTHDWNKFVAPGTLHGTLERAGLGIVETKGLAFDPLGWNWRMSSDTDVNYMVAAKRP